MPWTKECAAARPVGTRRGDAAAARPAAVRAGPADGGEIERRRAFRAAEARSNKQPELRRETRGGGEVAKAALERRRREIARRPGVATRRASTRRYDERYQTPYWYNDADGTSSWVAPPGWREADDAATWTAGRHERPDGDGDAALELVALEDRHDESKDAGVRRRGSRDDDDEYRRPGCKSTRTAAPPRLRRGHSVETSRAAAATRTFRRRRASRRRYGLRGDVDESDDEGGGMLPASRDRAETDRVYAETRWVMRSYCWCFYFHAFCCEGPCAALEAAARCACYFAAGVVLLPCKPKLAFKCLREATLFACLAPGPRGNVAAPLRMHRGAGVCS